jgi:hypothetical protein
MAGEPRERWSDFHVAQASLVTGRNPDLTSPEHQSPWYSADMRRSLIWIGAAAGAAMGRGFDPAGPPGDRLVDRVDSRRPAIDLV